MTSHIYDAKTRAHIGKYASYHCPQACVRHFTKLSVPESTARNFFEMPTSHNKIPHGLEKGCGSL